MAEYRIVRAGPEFRIEITQLGAVPQVAAGFDSAADANAWIEEDRRIAGIDARLVPAPPLRLREI